MDSYTPFFKLGSLTAVILLVVLQVNKEVNGLILYIYIYLKHLNYLQQ